MVQRVMRRPQGDARGLIEAIVDRVVGLRLTGRGWVVAFCLATLNWVGDIACLALIVTAVGSPVRWSRLILAWSVGVGAASFGITPGGVGLVEAALAGALVAAGIHAPQAVAAVLIYRLVSFWLVDALGWKLSRSRPGIAYVAERAVTTGCAQGQQPWLLALRLSATEAGSPEGR